MARMGSSQLVKSSDTKLRSIEPMCDEAQITGSRDRQTVATATGLAVLALAGCFLVCGQGTAFAADSKRRQSTDLTQLVIDTLAQSSGGSRCEASGRLRISISCEYIASEIVSKKNDPAIALKHASISFEPNHESHLHVELTFIQHGTMRFVADQPCYLAINGASGENYVRRVLPHLDFRKLTPGVAATFSDEFLAPALQPGRYLVQLWIPDPNPSSKLNPANGFLLGNVGVPDQTKGLNTIAAILVLR